MQYGYDQQAQGGEQWTPCPVTVRLEPMPFFVADWQVASHLRNCGEVASVRFQRNGEGVALARFHHPSGAAAALRWGELNLLGVRVYILPAWCEACFHQWPGVCSAAMNVPLQQRGMGQGGAPTSSVSTNRAPQASMPDVNGNTGDW